MIYDWIIIGGGAAGSFAAANLTERGQKVLLLEKGNKLMAKVKVSGGGRCNVTHQVKTTSELIPAYPRGGKALHNLFKAFGPKEMEAWLKERGVLLHAESDGRMFPETNDSQTIIDCFVRSMSGTRVMLSAEVIGFQKEEAYFTVNTRQSTYQGKKLLLATGGLLKGGLRETVEALGHPFEAEVPSLFTFNLPRHPITELTGLVAENAIASIPSSNFKSEGPILITHWGLSGPCILKLSSLAARHIAAAENNFIVTIQWIQDLSENEFKGWFQQHRQVHGKRKVYSHCPFELATRLWQFLLTEAGIDPTINWGDLNKEGLSKMIKALYHYELNIAGKTTFKEEFVTCGGISLASIMLKNMESKQVPGLHFAGELVDVDAITGGYNFQFAWSSAIAAIQS